MSRPEPYYRVDITRFPALPVDVELALFTDYRKRKTAAKREKIVKQYLYWAAELACRYCGPRMEKKDAISAANYGLMLAIDRFDPAFGKRFVTYSFFLIRQQVLYALRDSYVVNPESGLWAAQHRYDTSPKQEEDKLRLKKDRREIFDKAGAPDTINPQPDSGNEAFCEGDCRLEVENDSLLDEISRALPSLPEESRKVIQLRYFSPGKPPTFGEIGAKLRCTSDHALWVHNRAIQLLQKQLRAVKKEV